MAALKLLQAPDVLAREFLSDPSTPPQRMLRALILFSGYLLRGPIAGLSIAIFACSFGLLAVVGLGSFVKTLSQQEHVSKWFL